LDFFPEEWVKNFPWLSGVDNGVADPQYRLLKYLSSIHDGVTILDFGTSQGHSALALAQNKSNKVITYGLNLNGGAVSLLGKAPNVEIAALSVQEIEEEVILSSSFVFLDLDPHDGIQEAGVIERLKSIGYKGFVVCDDINWPAGMKEWWDSVDLNKYDVTEVGHASGTGIISFSNEEFNVIQDRKKDYNYCFTALAIGKEYEDLSVKRYNSLREKTKSCDFHLTVNNSELQDLGDRAFLNELHLDKFRDEGRPQFGCYLNMKCLALKATLEKYSGKHYDYIVYTDGDWQMHDKFEEEKVFKCFDLLEENENLDFIYERPGTVGDHKKTPDNLRQAWATVKIEDYNLRDHDLWDDAIMPNEQIYIFKNSWKFKMFVQEWEKFLWYTVANNMDNFGECFETGVSALLAGMKGTWHPFHSGSVLSQCFYFYCRNGIRHERF